MRVPLSWLADFVELTQTPEQLAEALTLGGIIVEAVTQPTAGTRGVVVGEIREFGPVPGSDKLSLVEVFDGQRSWEIVCGASNFAVGDRVPAALPGATLPGGVAIGTKRLMGATSNGMLASARELGVGEDHRGIWLLGDDAPIGADLAEWLSLDDTVLELELTPAQGYALSLVGLARDVAALTGAQLHVPPSPTDETLGLGGPDVPVTIADPVRCRRFDARRISGLTVAPSPPWLQRRLAAAGTRPIFNVVDATNATMIEVGNPIHAYDLALLAGPRIEVRTARPGEILVTLDGVARRLDPDDLVIADDTGPVALAGVMGGAATEIRDATTEVLLEVANFSADTVLRTARRHQLFTAGSTRWEKCVPPELAPIAAARCSGLIAMLSDGEVVGHSDSFPTPLERPVIRLRPARANRLLGLDLAASQQAALLERLDCEVALGLEAVEYRVVPPYWRPDLVIEEDLYEEIARIHGYEAIPETLPATGQVGGRTPAAEARRAVRRALAAGGWTEVLTFPFLAASDVESLGVAPDDLRRTAVGLVNPLSKEEAVLRTSLLPGLFRVVAHNTGRQNPDLALFEVGAVFLPPTAELPGAPSGQEGVTLPAEPVLLGLAACGAFASERWDRSGGRPGDLADVLGAADLIRGVLGLPALQAVPTTERPYHPGRAARLLRDGTEVGVVGELHPRVVEAFGLPARTLAGELRLDLLTEGGLQTPPAVAPSALPSLRIDVAVVVDEAVSAADVEAAVRAGAGPKLTALTLFDLYRGASIGEGRKSLAYRLRLDDPDHQLAAADEQRVIEAVAASVVALGGTLRR